MFTLLAILNVMSSVCFGAGGIPSFGLQTAESIRAKLPDSAFVIDSSKGIISNNTGFSFAIAELSEFPVLAGTDVQFFSALGEINPGATFIKHFHPRSAEYLYVISGDIRIEITLENSNPRIVKARVNETQSTAIPQGLPHLAVCVSTKPCKFIAVLNSADPGFVAA